MEFHNLQWNDEYALGLTNIDTEHKKLFIIVGKIFALEETLNVKDKIREILYELSDYVKVHFKDEEEFMQSIHYPDLAHHHKLHEQIIKNVANILNAHVTLDAIKTKMRIIAKHALIDHILEEDKKFQQFYFNLLKNEKNDLITDTIIILDDK